MTGLAGGFLALVVVGGLLFVLWPDGNDGDPSAPSSGSPPASNSSITITTAPEGVTWSVLGGRALPVSKTYGPTRSDGPVYAGYQRSPSGALLAAINIQWRAGLSPNGGWRQVLREQIMPGQGRDVIESVGFPDNPTPPEDGYGQTAGFRFVTFSPDRAVVEEALRFRNGLLQVQRLTVVWDRDDWRLEVQPDGKAGPYTAAIPNLNGFIKFESGV